MRGAQQLLAALAVVTAAHASLEQDDPRFQWSTAVAQTATHHGDSSHPTVRYSHDAVVWNDQMIVTHGYFYDRANNRPAWQDDTWAMSLTGEHKWTQLISGGKGDGVNHPHGRYGHAVALHGADLYLHGGTDGGTRVHGEPGFKLSMEFNELWRLSLVDLTWELLTPSEGHPYGPGKRYLHSAVAVANDVWLYGGSNRSDLWTWQTESSKWRQVVPKPTDPWPGRRQGHSAAELPQRGGFVVSGGTRWGFGSRALLDDLWVFKTTTERWEQLYARGTAPIPRLYHAIATLNGRIILHGGSSNTPGMKCQDDAWVFDPVTSTWTELATAPNAIYHHTLVVHEQTQTAFAFGGHKCGADTPTDHAYLNTVSKLRIPPKRSSLDGEL